MRAPAASSPEVRYRMQQVRRRDTEPEMALRRGLHGLGYRFRVDCSAAAGIHGRADIVFARNRVAVFVDGCFWHGCPDHASWPKSNAAWWRAKIERTIERDRATDETLILAGWTVMRVWEHESAGPAVDRVARVLTSQETPGRPTSRLSARTLL